MIYLKNVIRKMNRYIEDKSERKYKQLEASILRTADYFKQCLKKYYKLLKQLLKKTYLSNI